MVGHPDRLRCSQFRESEKPLRKQNNGADGLTQTHRRYCICAANAVAAREAMAAEGQAAQGLVLPRITNRKGRLAAAVMDPKRSGELPAAPQRDSRRAESRVRVKGWNT
jgi:hypothetical protein